MEILAKSEPQITLKEHIDDCLKILNFLKVQFPKISKLFKNRINFWDLLNYAVIFHDLGKSHPEFQNILYNKSNFWNRQRHELYSIPFVDALNIEKNDKEILKLVVACHHKELTNLYKQYISGIYLSASGSSSGLKGIDDESFINFEIEFNKIDLTALIQLLQNIYSIKINKINVPEINKVVTNNFRSKIQFGSEDYWLLTLLFGGLKHCDQLGSARVTNIPQIEKSDFKFLKIQRDELLSKGFDFYNHQVECSMIHTNLILTAPTGSGKTESAFLWLENQVNINGTGRVFYILPFTASINAMYLRLSKAIESDKFDKVGMIHGKLNDYLNNYFEDFQYSINEKKEKISSISDKFRLITTPIKVATPFQLLKHIFGLKGFEKGFFEWVGAYFVFDEIHAYSPDVFAQIKVLLEFVTKYLNVKVMIMTATMPTFLKREIESAIGNFSEITANDELYTQFRRHKVILKSGILKDNLELIRKDLNNGLKVLVVCNTVRQSQEVLNVTEKTVITTNKHYYNPNEMKMKFPK